MIQPARQKQTQGSNTKRTPAKKQGVTKPENVRSTGRKPNQQTEQKVKQIRSKGQAPQNIVVKKRKKIDGKVAANAIIAWLKDHKYDKETNYTIGVLNNDDLMISKVGGATAGIAAILALKGEILDQGYNVGRNIYLANKFVPQAASNHSEMCILAAAHARNQRVLYIKCTGPHCPFCAETMRYYKVQQGNDVGTVSQKGWAHPFLRLFYGTQVTNGGNQQAWVRELRQVHDALPQRIAVKYSGTVLSEPKGTSSLMTFEIVR